MQIDTFREWGNTFRRDAKKDGLTVLRNHLHRVGLPDEPEKLLDGTIMYMSACCAYLTIEGRPIEDFLSMQAYRPNLDPNSHYSFTFNLLSRAFGRIISPLDAKCLDLADLYGHPWDDYKMCGYSDFRVARIDGCALSKNEIAEIEEAITYDIRFDYTEDELDFWIDQDTIDGVLLVYLQDVERDEDEETK